MFKELLFILALCAFENVAYGHERHCKYVSCNSNRYKYRKCKVPGAHMVESVSVQYRQSRSSCTYGRSFGKSGPYIWVNRGCRATFNVCFRPVKRPSCVSISCNSYGFKYKRCKVPGSRYVRSVSVLVKKSVSRCTYRKSFGKLIGDIWAAHGCRAKFKVCFKRGTSKDVYCSSKGYRRATCYVGKKVTSVTLLRHYSKSPCIPGHSFGQKGNYIYVDHGCRAKFRVFRSL